MAAAPDGPSGLQGAVGITWLAPLTYCPDPWPGLGTVKENIPGTRRTLYYH